jgi:hypothetical protein
MMIVFLLAAIGVPVGLLVVGLFYVWWSRRRFRARAEVFVCRLRAAGPEAKGGWPRAKRYGCWAHDVLLVYGGPALRRCEVFPVAGASGPVPAPAAKGMGGQARMLRLQLDDGRQFDMVTRDDDVTLAIGPFVAASMM